jgi:acyl carrier protein
VIEQELLDYIRTEIAYDRPGELTADDPLLDGVLDSLGMLRLTVFLEERYAVTVDDTELVPDNFMTVAALASFLRRKGVG